jgi:hypothetical protein
MTTIGTTIGYPVILSAAKDHSGQLSRPKVASAHERWFGFTDKNPEVIMLSTRFSRFRKLL